jgi:hypothetical protein
MASQALVPRVTFLFVPRKSALQFAAMRAVCLVLLVTTGCCSAIAQPSGATPVRVCVAKISNQTPTKFEMEKLQQAYLNGLQTLKLAKSAGVTLVPVSATNSDDAKTEVDKAGCEFAVYTRILRKPKEDTRTFESGTTYQVSKHDESPTEIYGLQCTVERTSTGMPILIDRQFDDVPTKGDKGVLKLLASEAVRVDDALQKKIPN